MGKQPDQPLDLSALAKAPPQAGPPKAAAPQATPAKGTPAKGTPQKPEPKKEEPKKEEPQPPAISSGTYKAAVCGDGIGVGSFEQLSAKKSGKTLEDWRKAVTEALQQAAEGDARGPSTTLTKAQADELHSVGDALAGKTEGTTAWNSPDQLESLLDGKLPGLDSFAGTGSGYTAHKRPMWGYLYQKGLAYEADWQHQTAASWVNNGKRTYADGAEIPYFVAPSDDPHPLGTYAKITANGKTVYARLYEKGPALGEVSLSVWKGLGYTNVTPNNAPLNKLQIDILEGSGGMNTDPSKGLLSYDEIQRAGKLIEEGWAKKIRTKDELEAAEKKAAAAKGEGTEQPGGNRLKQGRNDVRIEREMRQAGYACTECLHDGGGHVIEGSASVYVWKYPFARIGDGTSDNLRVATGADTVRVHGPTTSAPLPIA